MLRWRHPQGSLALYRRHLASCKHLDKGNRWIRCQCPIWVHGSIGGETIRRGLNTGNWTAASTIVHPWQSSGRIDVLKPELPSVTAAVEQFLEEAAVRNLAATTIKKRRELLEGKLFALLCPQSVPATARSDGRADARVSPRLEVLAALRREAFGVSSRVLPVLCQLNCERDSIKATGEAYGALLVQNSKRTPN